MTTLKNMYEEQKIKIEGALLFIIGSILTVNYAHADYDIGGPDDGPLARLTTFVQMVVNFVDGPVAFAFSFFSIVGMALTWAIAPKMVAAMGVFVRVTIAVIVILNVGVWITAYNS